MHSDKLAERRKKLVEKMGVYFEEEKKISPLTARIMSYLIVNGEYGTAFDELVTELEASKSTISTLLNTLEEQKCIKYFTKRGGRKRYYVIAPGYICRKLNIIISQWKTELDLQNELLTYKSLFNRRHPEEALSLSPHKNAIRFFKETIAFLEEQNSIYKRIETQINH